MNFSLSLALLAKKPLTEAGRLSTRCFRGYMTVRSVAKRGPVMLISGSVCPGDKCSSGLGV